MLGTKITLFDPKPMSLIAYRDERITRLFGTAENPERRLSVVVLLAEGGAMPLTMCSTGTSTKVASSERTRITERDRMAIPFGLVAVPPKVTRNWLRSGLSLRAALTSGSFLAKAGSMFSSRKEEAIESLLSFSCWTRIPTRPIFVPCVMSGRFGCTRQSLASIGLRKRSGFDAVDRVHRKGKHDVGRVAGLEKPGRTGLIGAVRFRMNCDPVWGV